MFDSENPQASPAQVIELDWDAYFIEFQQMHGGEPILHKPTNRLLFRDGWAYSSSDTRGPEWPPPTDPTARNRLLIDYWETRRGMIYRKLESLKTKVRVFQEEQRIRSAPLQRKVITRDENGRARVVSQRLDLPIIETEIAILDNALDECDNQLTELRDSKKE